jgi:hypothetical protein
VNRRVGVRVVMPASRASRPGVGARSSRARAPRRDVRGHRGRAGVWAAAVSLPPVVLLGLLSGGYLLAPAGLAVAALLHRRIGARRGGGRRGEGVTPGRSAATGAR